MTGHKRRHTELPPGAVGPSTCGRMRILEGFEPPTTRLDRQKLLYGRRSSAVGGRSLLTRHSHDTIFAWNAGRSVLGIENSDGPIRRPGRSILLRSIV